MPLLSLISSACCGSGCCGAACSCSCPGRGCLK